jgi:hypothetical protein
MNRSIIFRIVVALVLLVVLAAGAVGLGLTAYNAGVTQGLAQSGKLTVPPAGAMPYPYAGPFFRYGFFGPGLGLFNCLFVLLGLFLIFALMRGLMFVVFGPRHWGGQRGAFGPGSRGGPWGWHRPWGEKGYPPMFDEWHRQAHGQTDGPSTPPSEPNKA